MVTIVETEQDIEQVLKHKDKQAYIHIITGNASYHDKLSYVVAVYLRVKELTWVLPINHSECINLDLNQVEQILQSFTELNVVDRKQTLYFFNLKNTKDIYLRHILTQYNDQDISARHPTMDWYYSNYIHRKDINSIIPILVLTDYCDRVYSRVDSLIQQKDPGFFDFYNKMYINVFYYIEQTGIKIDVDSFNQVYGLENNSYNIKGTKVYTKYNLYNKTTRPTNAFNKINFGAIPKTGGFRECFIPENDSFIEFDFDGYHLRLIANEIGYIIGNEKAHKHLARQVYGKTNITNKEYTEIKQKNFEAIYGKIPENFLTVEFYKKLKHYIEQTWNKFKNDKYIRNTVTGLTFTETLKNTYPSKLVNYLLQSLETGNNIYTVYNVLKYLQDKYTKLVLYNYDALVFDYSKKDGEGLIKDIKQIMESNNFLVEYKYSRNLNFEK